MTLQVILIASLAANVLLAVMTYSYLAALRTHGQAILLEDKRTGGKQE